MMFSRSLIAALGLVAAAHAFAQDPTDKKPCHEPQCPVVQRGDAVVTVADVMAKLMGLDERKQNALLSDPKQINNMLENLLITRQIANDVDRDKAANDAALQARLKQATDDVLAVYRLDEIRASRIRSNFETLAREYYLANKADMHTPKIATVRHLLITPEKRGEVLAKAQIESLHEELKSANAGTFAERVLELSDDPSKATNAGIIKVIDGNTDIDEDFARAALSLSMPGEVSEPIQTQFGYHLLQLVESNDEVVLTFEQAKPRIVEKLQDDARRRVVLDYRGELMSTAELQAFPDNLAGLIYGDDAATSSSEGKDSE
jgi:peptidyl-prolyl cis-trans isomerase C